MGIPMLVWFLAGFATWILIAVFFGKVTVADLMIASGVSVTGPLLPLVIGAWYVASWLNSLGKIVIWEKRKRVMPLEAAQA